jgi:pimeloyl-ACP methyl ester carboxylesterase
MSPRHEPLVVLVHGAWHGAWCWAALQADLDRRGIASIAIDLPGHGASSLPLGDLHGDAAHVVAVLEHLDRDQRGDEGGGIVLVGHSYGGAVITEAAASCPSVKHLVYLTAFALNDGESVRLVRSEMPRAETLLSSASRPHTEGTTVIEPSLAQAALYGCCPDGVAAAAIARLDPQPIATFLQPVSGSPRSVMPSTYVCCELDEAISIVHQRLMAERCDRVVTLRTDHSPFASMPEATADIIESIVRA